MIRVDSAYPDVLAKFNVPLTNDQFKVDVRWLLECGFCICSCDDIPPEDIIAGRAFALTMNAKLVHRFLARPQKRRMFEKIVDRHSLEHLANVRHLSRDGTFVDFPALI